MITQTPDYEDIYGALRAMVIAAGGSKVVANRLWPTKQVAEAQRELLDALNRDRARKLDPEDLMAIMKMAHAAGMHAGKHWLDAQLGYQATPPTDPAIERDRLADAILEATRELKRLTDTAERLAPKGLRVA